MNYSRTCHPTSMVLAHNIQTVTATAWTALLYVSHITERLPLGDNDDTGGEGTQQW